MSVLIDANSDYVDIAYDAKWILNPASDDISFTYYVKASDYPAAPGDYQIYFQSDESGANKITVMSYYHTDLHFLYAIFLRDSGYNPLAYIMWFGITFSDNQWYHIVVNADAVGTNARLYIDKVSQGAGDLVVWSSVGNIAPHDRIGISDGSGIYASYNMTHFIAVKDVLTVAEIDQYYRDPYTCLDNPDLIGYFPMLEPSGLAHDKASTPTHGTLTDGATFDVGDDPLLGWANKEINDIDIVYPDKISGLRTGQIHKVSGV